MQTEFPGTNWKSGFGIAFARQSQIRPFVAVAVVLDQWGYRSLLAKPLVLLS